MSRERVDRLIALAIDDGASENERRNAALQAVKLIAKEELLDDHDELDRLKKEIRWLRGQLRQIATIVRGHVEVAVVVNPSEEELDGIRKNRAWSIGKARFSGRFCPDCNTPILDGDPIATRRVSVPEQPDTLHLRCFHKRQKEGRL